MPERKLPPIIFGVPRWMKYAACKGAGLSVSEFFPPPASQLRPEVLDLCRGCPVRAECLRRAYSQDFAAGWWGGMSASQRERLSLEEALELTEQDSEEYLASLEEE